MTCKFLEYFRFIFLGYSKRFTLLFLKIRIWHCCHFLGQVKHTYLDGYKSKLYYAPTVLGEKS